MKVLPFCQTIIDILIMKITGQNKTLRQVSSSVAPAGGYFNFEGVEKSSPLYPLDQRSAHSGSDPGFQVEDLGVILMAPNAKGEWNANDVAVYDQPGLLKAIARNVALRYRRIIVDMKG